MAKRRRVKPAPSGGELAPASDSTAPLLSGVRGFDPMSIAVGMLGGAVIYVTYYPSDSVAVEAGDALWFAVLSICIATIVWSSLWWFAAEATPVIHADDSDLSTQNSGDTRSRRMALLASHVLDIVPWLLAAWMMVAAFASCPPGNLRMATNEAWFWVAAAAIFTSTRRLLAALPTRQAMLVLLVVCGVGLAVHGLHQYFWSLPVNRAEYEQNPERVLRLAGIDAPPGSAERMVFENRLFDGGPTGTFALANSLAAVLVFTVVLTAGVLRLHWRSLSPSRRIVWTIAGALCATCLLAARSRSAMLAMFVGVALMLVASSRLRDKNPKALLWGLAGMSLFGIAFAVIIAMVGNREWFEEAPASLAFRFQYWRATWQMVMDQPLLGAGPGNFQSIYERYREASASEQIAEPHNLFFETLASGGFLGLGLFLVVMVGGFFVVTQRQVRSPINTGDQSDCSPEIHQQDSAVHRERWLWLGAILSVLMIWLIGWVSRRTPDLQASLFVLPASVAAAWLLWPSVRTMAGRDIDSLLGVALIAIGIHLLAAGGWTVPGVAMIVWVAAAMLTHTGDAIASTYSRKPFVSLWMLGCGMLLLGALYTQSLRPVEDQKRLMAVAAMAQRKGQIEKVRVTLERAAESDPWSPDAMLLLADFYRWRLILQAKDLDARRRWESCLQEAKRRGGDDPALYRVVGTQQLHVFQRHGNPADLAAAADSFGRAVRWSPSNQWMMAQMAVVEAARGDRQAAETLASRARVLADLGGNIERALFLQQVYVARPLGVLADRGPVRRPADQLLPEPNSPE